ncbi:MAG: hypothetical protein HY820_11705 [Acidobacteria bacterium]|nr:hypothetical protein [Acidobacteriota bacterium]
MKNSLAGMALAVAGVLLTGCSPINFLYPLFEDRRDLAEDADIGGTWVADNDKWTFRKLPDGTYSLTWTNGKETEERAAALVRISNYLFLDMASQEEGTAIRGHEFLMVRSQGDQLEVAGIDAKWLEAKLTRERALPFEKPCVNKDGKNKRCAHVVTAGTADLQNFLLRHAGDSAAFPEWSTLKRAGL